ncbi:hypothetical protein BC826DRAFT_720192 [Russula brevipes]|nr:hypothetical protein BC826DRAFT_720192 [Russula brevipes]
MTWVCSCMQRASMCSTAIFRILDVGAVHFIHETPHSPSTASRTYSSVGSDLALVRRNRASDRLQSARNSRAANKVKRAAMNDQRAFVWRTLTSDSVSARAFL